MYNKFNKNIIINKSRNTYGEFKQTNEIILNAYINRIDKNSYDIKVIESETSYKIIINNKLERV